LEALLGRGPVARDESATAAGAPVELSVYEIDRNPFQPRRDFDEEAIASLAESIREHGILQPLVVRHVEGRHQLIAGERRLRAAIKVGRSTVPVHVVEADDQRVAELAIVENLQRKDLNPLEKAASFQQYLARYGCTQEELAGRLKIDRSTVANLIRLLELPEAVQDALRRGQITQGHARALLPLGDEAEQVRFARRIAEEELSVRAVEELVQAHIREADGEPLEATDEAPPDGTAVRGGYLTALEQTFRSALGTRVEVKQSRRGRGKIVVHFTSHEEFERLRGLLCGETAEVHRRQAG
jgi:ParB family chromosome partitioning protein